MLVRDRPVWSFPADHCPERTEGVVAPNLVVLRGADPVPARVDRVDSGGTELQAALCLPSPGQVQGAHDPSRVATERIQEAAQQVELE